MGKTGAGSQGGGVGKEKGVPCDTPPQSYPTGWRRSRWGPEKRRLQAQPACAGTWLGCLSLGT